MYCGEKALYLESEVLSLFIYFKLHFNKYISNILLNFACFWTLNEQNYMARIILSFASFTQKYAYQTHIACLCSKHSQNHIPKSKVILLSLTVKYDVNWCAAVWHPSSSMGWNIPIGLFNRGGSKGSVNEYDSPEALVDRTWNSASLS